ncbi:ParB/RepB/Spo0J family partition protein [Campylobacter hyointestinalis]|uniref:Chromosome partitioning protein ParB n=1 Tax=Campylobacter hyointestinalis subsp. hyointestinalis TaxID=91352 RepID=A0A855NAN4_CAMHY|nr:ParB/RepB/Spo0J family partition protein [Campylobacter hyointestinalis]ANE33177.1 chromosome partitioning protein [Campylobacter hyointestinalis subsp. hyointestinalis LMG 9260]KEA44757.1 chromosome partitioning protein ParB [Campylobacter hyointestinalis subsp. hyointestinalis]PPB59705.1 chromosome partitioning protein ParB [Campylobacter hyointestinalis subsp. hyointestinalis]PPB64654.1 chromosome partitioning protein ParB [Campylobacter hyointestinalis subsp. hyointestinalis]PPB72458.1 
MALGRGLSSILSDVEEAYDKELNRDLVKDIDIDKIIPNPYQPRTYFDEEALSELSQSIEKHGLIQPIIVIQNKNGYTLIAGERRLRATKMLGRSSIKAIVANLEDKNLRELALIENIQRENLSPIELANSYKELIEEYKITQEALSNIIKKSRTVITNTLRLLTLGDDTKKLIEDGKLTQGHAKIIVGLKKDDEKMVVDTIIGQRLNVRDTENLVKRLKNRSDKSSNLDNIQQDYNDNLSLLQAAFSNLGLNCKINKKKIILNLKDTDEIKYLIAKIQ